MPQYKDFISDALHTAGEIALSRFGDGVKDTKTDITDFVTETDLIINTFLVEKIEDSFPADSIVSEEAPNSHSFDKKTFSSCWVIDPIDGTANFSSSIPLFGCMMAHISDNIVDAAGVYLPKMDEYFSAELNRGAYLNGEVIQCSKKKNWPLTFGCSSASLNPEKKLMRDTLSQAADQEKFWLNGFGSAAVSGCYVASGRRDWYVSKGGLVWDYAPISLILQEAGCTITNFSGATWQPTDRELIAAYPPLHKTLLALF